MAVASVAETLAAIDRLLTPKGVRWAVLGAWEVEERYRELRQRAQDERTTGRWRH